MENNTIIKNAGSNFHALTTVTHTAVHLSSILGDRHDPTFIREGKAREVRGVAQAPAANKL